MTFGTNEVFLCDLFHDDASGSIFFPQAALHVLTFIDARSIFHTSPTLSLRLPLSSHVHALHMDLTRDIGVTMATWSEAPLFPPRGCRSSKPLLLSLQRPGQTGSIRTSAWLLMQQCVRPPKLYVLLYYVKFVVCMSVCVSVCVCVARVQECRTGCREKIPETVESEQKPPWGASLTIT